MRTTLNIDDELVMRAKVLAAREQRTFTSLVEEALRLALLRERVAAHEQSRMALPFIDMAFPPDLDTSSNAAVADYLDQLDGLTGR